MIRKLRRKFILIASGAILLILVIVLTSINFVSYYSNYSEIMSIIDFISDNYGHMPIESPRKSDVDFYVTRELSYETRYFSVILDEDNQFVMTNYDHISSVTKEETETIYNLISRDDSDHGKLTISDSLYFYKIKYSTGAELAKALPYIENSSAFSEDSNYRIAVFMDCSNRMYRVQTLRFFSLFTGIICFLLFFSIVSALSRKAVKPVIENYEKQKQFITNAGHELKTPLAIISANTEVMEAMDGKSEWTQSTINQVNRLSGLVNDLIALARLEESAEKEEIVPENIDFSAKVKEIAESFKPLAEQQYKELKIHIADGITVKGNEKALHELVTILVDNAVKYCDEDGLVLVSLVKFKKLARLQVSNTYKNGEGTDYNRFFERFYREDVSHNSEKAGYGIGLSMAESIVKLHHGKITVSYDGRVSKMISFIVTL